MQVSYDNHLKQAVEELESARKRLEALLQRSKTWRALSVVEAASGRGQKARPTGQGKRQLRRKLLAENPVYRPYLRLVDAISLLRQATDMPAEQLSSAQVLDSAAREDALAQSLVAEAKPRIKIKAVSRSLPQSTSDASSHDANSKTLSEILADAGFRIGGDPAPQPPTLEPRLPAVAGVAQPYPEERFPALSVEEAEVVIVHGEAAKLAAAGTREMPGPVALSARIRRAVQEAAEDEQHEPFHGAIEEAEVEIFRPSDVAVAGTTTT